VATDKGIRVRPSTAPRIVVTRDVEGVRIPKSRVTTILSAIMRDAKQSGTVHLIIVDDVTIRRLNRRFKGRDSTTDVLSFPMGGDMPGTESVTIIGEIYCNYSHCRRWSEDNGGTVADELLRLAVHGCLHLFGYDHHKPEDQSRMLRAEIKYLGQSGLIRERVTMEAMRGRG
jgi:probable rRNA maturation factor